MCWVCTMYNSTVSNTSSLFTASWRYTISPVIQSKGPFSLDKLHLNLCSSCGGSTGMCSPVLLNKRVGLRLAWPVCEYVPERVTLCVRVGVSMSPRPDPDHIWVSLTHTALLVYPSPRKQTGCGNNKSFVPVEEDTPGKQTDESPSE